MHFLCNNGFRVGMLEVKYFFALIVVRRVTVIGRITLLLKTDVCIYTYLCIDTEYLFLDGMEHHKFGDMITHSEPRQKLLRGDLGNSCVVGAAFSNQS